MTAVISNPASFRLEAEFQRVCAVCEKPGPWQPHHVIPKQWLDKHGFPLWNTRNALRLCVRCHMQYEHSGRQVVVPEAKLTDLNVCYVFETMGPAGMDFLVRRYGAVGHRFAAHLAGDGCWACR